jgi:FlaA1/EpsC-like NDP-sugar epimerase
MQNPELHSPPWRFNRNVIAALHDAFMAAASFFLAVYIRLGYDQLHTATDYLKLGTVLFTAVCLGVFVSMRLYRGLWRYASMRDLVTITKAVSLSVLIFAALMFVVNRLEGIPRSVLFINWMLLLAMLGAPRFAYRAIKDRTLHWRMTLDEVAKIPVLLIGANDVAERFIRDMARDPLAPYQPVAILDDDPKQKDRTIHRIPIYGSVGILPVVVRKMERKGKRLQKIILTDASADGEAIRRLLDLTETFAIPIARLPKPGEMKAGVADKRDVQPIAVEDLLGRPQNVLDREAMRKLVENECVLVTGAGGTIGSELSRQIASYGPKRLILTEISEFNLYQIEREMRAAFPHLKVTALLGDVRDSAHTDQMFRDHAPTLVFHAAAIKHVPIAELNPEEAVLTNAFGTASVAEACHKYHVKAMVMISTDKAVNPANVMGASKRLAETYCQSLAQASSTRFITVRFGNVLGSTGSVVPLFTEQLAKGGPVTVTHPEMTRYFMTVREAVELVLQAAALGVAMKGRRDCIFVLDMGKPVRILDLALQMIRLAGLRPYEDIAIAYTGLRPGEKLYEELFYISENAVKTTHESIYLASLQCADIGILKAGMERLQASCRERRPGEVKAILVQLVPEFKPESSDSDNDHQARADLRLR